jgi:hypothetical protein
MNTAIKSDNEMQAILDRISANDAQAQADKIAAEEVARTLRLARIASTPINTNCICTMDQIENGYSVCACAKVTAWN